MICLKSLRTTDHVCGASLINQHLVRLVNDDIGQRQGHCELGLGSGVKISQVVKDEGLSGKVHYAPSCNRLLSSGRMEEYLQAATLGYALGQKLSLPYADGPGDI